MTWSASRMRTSLAVLCTSTVRRARAVRHAAKVVIDRDHAVPEQPSSTWR